MNRPLWVTYLGPVPSTLIKGLAFIVSVGELRHFSLVAQLYLVLVVFFDLEQHFSHNWRRSKQQYLLFSEENGFTESQRT